MGIVSHWWTCNENHAQYLLAIFTIMVIVELGQTREITVFVLDLS